MPKLRRLGGRDVIRLLHQLGFETFRVRGSHHIMRIGTCSVVVPLHGNDSLATGTLRQIYKDALNCVPEDQLRPLFYTD